MGKEAGGIVRGLVLMLAVATVSCEPTQKSEQKDLPKSNQVTSATAIALPLVFEANRGQTDKRVGFVVRRPGYTLFLTPDEAVLRLAVPATPSKSGSRGQQKRLADDRQGPHTLRMKLLGARSGIQPIGVDQQRGKVNHIHGNDPRKWLTGIPTYTRVRYPDVLSGIDLVFYGGNGRLRYDFVVAPGADPGAIRLKFTGAGHLEIDQNGNLILDTRAGPIVHTAPSLYQSVDGRRIPVGGGFVLRGPTEVGFKVDTWNRAAPLVIDPGIVFGTYFGGIAGEVCGDVPADAHIGMSVNDQDQVFVTGCTYSVDFPDTDQPAGDIQHPGTREVFVFRIDMAPDNSATLGYSTYFGGSGNDGGYGSIRYCD